MQLKTWQKSIVFPLKCKPACLHDVMSSLCVREDWAPAVFRCFHTWTVVLCSETDDLWPKQFAYFPWPLLCSKRIIVQGAKSHPLPDISLHPCVTASCVQAMLCIVGHCHDNDDNNNNKIRCRLTWCNTEVKCLMNIWAEDYVATLLDTTTKSWGTTRGGTREEGLRTLCWTVGETHKGKRLFYLYWQAIFWCLSAGSTYRGWLFQLHCHSKQLLPGFKWHRDHLFWAILARLFCSATAVSTLCWTVKMQTHYRDKVHEMVESIFRYVTICVCVQVCVSPV